MISLNLNDHLSESGHSSILSLPVMPTTHHLVHSVDITRVVSYHVLQLTRREAHDPAQTLPAAAQVFADLDLVSLLDLAAAPVVLGRKEDVEKTME